MAVRLQLLVCFLDEGEESHVARRAALVPVELPSPPRGALEAGMGDPERIRSSYWILENLQDQDPILILF